MKQRHHALAACVLASLAIHSCKPRQFNARPKSVDNKGLDVSDLSFLYPIPADRGVIGARVVASRNNPARLASRFDSEVPQWINAYIPAVDNPPPPFAFDVFPTLPERKFRGALSLAEFTSVFCQSYREARRYDQPAERNLYPFGFNNVSDASTATMKEFCPEASKQPTEQGQKPYWRPHPDEKQRIGHQKKLAEMYVHTDIDLGFAPAANPAAWVVLGARFDLCFGLPSEMLKLITAEKKEERIHALGRNEKGRVTAHIPKAVRDVCRPKLRLVAQPFNFGGITQTTVAAGNRVQDFALHIVYEIPVERLGEVIADAMELKELARQLTGQSTTGVPLYVHPGFGYDPVGEFPVAGRETVTESDARAKVLKFSDVLNSRLGKYIDRTNLPETDRARLTDVEFFGSLIDPPGAIVLRWIFAQFNPDPKTGELRIKNLPFIGGGKVMTTRAFGRSADETFEPPLTSAFKSRPKIPHLMGLVDTALQRSSASMDAQGNITPEAKQAMEVAMRDAARVDNPYLLNFKSSDCVSCHMGTSYRTMLRKLAERGVDKKKFQDLEIWDDVTRIDEDGARPYFSPGVTRERKSDSMADTVLLNPQIASQFANATNETRDLFQGKPFLTDFGVTRVDYVQRNFGYFFRWPNVSQRTINEAAANATFANELVDLESFKKLGAATP